MNFLARHKNFFIVLSVAIILFFSTVGFWSGLHMKFKIYQFVKSKVGLELDMGMVYANPFTGNGYIKNLRVENPPGYVSKNALLIREISFQGNRKTFYSESIALDHLLLSGIEINYEPKSDNNNFQQLYFDAAKYYNSNARGSDDWFKSLSMGVLEIDPIEINLGPKVLNKKIVIDAVSIEGLVGSDEQPLYYRDFGDIVFSRYAKELRKALSTSGGSLPDELKQRILFWVDVWEKRSE